MSTSRQEEIIKEGFIKSLLEGKLELKDLAGINIDLDMARQAYLQGVQETTQELIELVKENMATAAKQSTIANAVAQTTEQVSQTKTAVLLVKDAVSAVQLGTDKIIDDMATNDSLIKIKFEGIDIVELTSDVEVEAEGGTDSQTSYADVGYIFEILGLMVNIPVPSGGTGTPKYHYVELKASGGVGISLLKLSSYGNVALVYDYGEVLSADKERLPTSDEIALQNIRGYRYDEDTGITITYVNNTNAIQTGIRFCRLWVRKLRVA